MPERGKPISEHEPSLAASMDAWLVGRENRLTISSATAYQYRSVMTDFCEFVGPDRPVGSVGMADVERWLAKPRRNGEPYAAASINSRSNSIRAYFRWALKAGIITSNPADDIERSKTGRRVQKGLVPELVQRLLWLADGRERTILLTGLQLGLRREEIANMDFQHWNRRDKVLYVIGKGNKERVLPVVGEIEETFMMWQDVGLGGRNVGPFWPSATAVSGRTSPDHIGRIVTDLALKCGVKATCHTLRHTCALDMVRAGVPHSVIQAWLGHESLATTSLYVVANQSDLMGFAEARKYMTPLAS